MVRFRTLPSSTAPNFARPIVAGWTCHSLGGQGVHRLNGGTAENYNLLRLVGVQLTRAIASDNLIQSSSDSLMNMQVEERSSTAQRQKFIF